MCDNVRLCASSRARVRCACVCVQCMCTCECYTAGKPGSPSEQRPAGSCQQLFPNTAELRALLAADACPLVLPAPSSQHHRAARELRRSPSPTPLSKAAYCWLRLWPSRPHSSCADVAWGPDGTSPIFTAGKQRQERGCRTASDSRIYSKQASVWKVVAPPVDSTASPMGCGCTNRGRWFHSPGAPAHSQPCLHTQPYFWQPTAPRGCSPFVALPCWDHLHGPTPAVSRLSLGCSFPPGAGGSCSTSVRKWIRGQTKGICPGLRSSPGTPPLRSPVPAHGLLQAAASPPLALRK